MAMASLHFAVASPINSFFTPIYTHNSLSSGVLVKIFVSPELRRNNRLRRVGFTRASVSRAEQDNYDPELRLVLELATDSELFELENILFGPSYFSPLFKSITKKKEVDYSMIGKDLQERDNFIAALESRFLFLAADARSTLRGWRPSYRNVLLSVRKELKIPCSNKLSTEDLEAEIFLHLLQEYSRHVSELNQLIGLPTFCFRKEYQKVLSEEFGASRNSTSDSEGGLELGLSGWKVQALSALKELRSMVLKGGGIVTFAKIYQLLSSRLSGKLFLEGANYQIKREVIKKGGQIAAFNLESRAALLAARQGFAGAASRYLGFRSMMSLLGPMLWGTLLADVVIQMLGTDYARILRAIYAFAQIRITRTYNLPSVSSDDEWGV